MHRTQQPLPTVREEAPLEPAGASPPAKPRPARGVAFYGPGPVLMFAAWVLAVWMSGKMGILVLIPASRIVWESTEPGDTAMAIGMCSLAW